MSSLEPTEILSVIHLQELLNELDESNLEESIKKITESVFLENEEKIKELFVETCWMIPIRSNMLHTFAKFLFGISKCEKIENNSELKETFKKQLLDTLADRDVPQIIYILYKEFEYFTESEVSRINGTLKSYMFFDKFDDNSILWDHPLLMKFRNKPESATDTINELRENYWLKNSLGYALRNDKVSILQDEITKNDQFNFNEILEWSTFEVSERPPSLSLLGIAAFFGAFNCFSFINVSGGVIDEDVVRCAIMGGNLEIIKICEDLLKDDLVKACYKDAFQFHHMAIMKWLLNYGEKAEIEPIECILEHNYTYLDQLVSEGSDISTYGVNESGITPLILATQHAALDLMQYLINRGASPNESDKSGRSPLHFAVKAKDIESILLLIKNGADVNAKDSRGRTPLMYAAIDVSARCVKVLIENNADPSIADHNGKLPQERCLNNKEIINLLSKAE